MWRLLEIIALAALVLLAITEFFYPLLAGKPFFGSFRKKNRLVEKDPAALDEKLERAREKVRDVKNVQDEVNQHYKSAEQLKREADELLGKKDKREGPYFNEN